MWLMPYYLGGAAVAQVASIANRYVGWQTVLLTGPVMYLIYRTYRLYVQRLEQQKKHAEAMSVAAFADHRSAGAGDRGQGPHHPRPYPAGAGIRHGTGQAN